MDFLERLNPRQREAVQHIEGPLLILAGAGSGKTRVITHRIAHLMAVHRIPGWAILAVTFTNKAAGEMRERVRELLAGTEADAFPTIATFHSFCVRLLRRDGAPLASVRPGFTTRFTIYDDDDQMMIVKAAYKQLGLDEKFMQPRAAISRISQAKSNQETPEEMARSASDPITSRLAVVYERYEAKLRESNALDFDDLLLEAVRLLRHDPLTCKRLNDRYEFVMVDEYQDTNRSQYELMRLLTEERQNICVVGDEDQSIYGWRGANIRNILDFEHDFPGATVIRLEQNYRSTKAILDAASAVVAHNTERIGKWLWTESGEGEKITLYEAPDAENEALYIADTIENHLARNPKDRVAVLYRTNAQSRQIEEALRGQGHSRVLEGVDRPAGFGEPAAHHQHSGARHRPHDHRADRAVFADASPFPMGSARPDARTARVSIPRRSRAFGFSQDDPGTGGGGREPARGGHSSRCSRAHRVQQDARRRGHRGSSRAPGES
jgi:DNA helicase-2/ATP-dependent DNA helicase PcrA